MNKDKLEKEFNKLMIDYSLNPNPEILDRIYQIADKLVLDEKTTFHLKHLALERLEELEKIIDLNPLLQYRKAVTLLLLKKKEQALEIFRKIIHLKNAEAYIKHRCMGYVLRHYDTVIRNDEAIQYLEKLRKSSDSTALHMLEEIEMSALYNLEAEIDEEERLEEPILIFTSSDRIERPISKKVTEANFRLGNSPNDYDLYLDMLQQRFFIFGKEIKLSKKEVAALFTMAKLGPRCNIEELYFAVYEKLYENQKKQKDNLQQFTSRFRKRTLSPFGFGFQGYNLPNQYSFCLIYNREVDDYLFG